MRANRRKSVRDEEERLWRRKLRGLLWMDRLFSPLFVLFYILAFRTLVQLCVYGGVKRRVPLLALCVLFFVGYLAAYLAELQIIAKQSWKTMVTDLEIEGNQIFTERFEEDGQEKTEQQTGGQKDRIVELSEVRWYRKKGRHIFLFLKRHRFVWLNTENLSEQKREFLELKLTQTGILALRLWRIPAALLLAAVTFLGSAGIVWSAVPYNGKLSWKLDELQHSRKIRLVHDNIYEDGLDGILEDIRKKIDLPERLCLVNSFNLHFLADGTVDTLYTFVKGYDEAGNYQDSYLISYNRSSSDKLTVWMGGAAGTEFEQEKDFMPLLEAMRVLPLQDTVQDWDEEVYGILYYGERSFGYNTEGIRYLDPDGEIFLPDPNVSEEIKGFIVSVFCPENESITPVRYLFRETL